jgi:hypothetical protein
MQVAEAREEVDSQSYPLSWMSYQLPGNGSKKVCLHVQAGALTIGAKPYRHAEVSVDRQCTSKDCVRVRVRSIPTFNYIGQVSLNDDTGVGDAP